MTTNNDTSFSSSGAPAGLTAQEIAEHEIALDELSNLELQFAKVELDQRLRTPPTSGPNTTADIFPLREIKRACSPPTLCKAPADHLPHS